eukprot:89950-Chlamydomonas_euryale.AAC.5
MVEACMRPAKDDHAPHIAQLMVEACMRPAKDDHAPHIAQCVFSMPPNAERVASHSGPKWT